jgi:Putative transmembrane protein (PGPGW)
MQQAGRMAVAIVGFTITLLGVVMLVTPGPGWLAILLGLGVLGVEFVWARRRLGRLRKGGAELIRSVFPAHKYCWARRERQWVLQTDGRTQLQTP